nr:putative CRISPR-associated protein [Ardenticatena sp.]
MQNFIVSPVGISLFLNYVSNYVSDSDGVLRGNLIKHSNDQELPAELAGEVEELSEKILKDLVDANIQERRRLSAELNGIYGLFPDGQLPTRDSHLLIATDTELGTTAAKILKNFLRRNGVQDVQILSPEGLQSKDEIQFRRAIRDLFKQVQEIVQGYQNYNYNIIFNLVGGFKSLQSYLTISGMFYADKITYIFEGTNNLLTIPRLPLKVDDKKLRQPEYAVQLALLSAGYLYSRDEIRLPGALWEEDQNGDVTISAWGQLIWDQIKSDILSEELLEFPCLEYGKTFRDDFKKNTSKRVALQETLAKVSKLLLENNGNPQALKKDGGLQYDNYTNKSLSDGTPIGHFRINQGDRVTCVARNGKLYLRYFGSHDHTERNEGIK